MAVTRIADIIVPEVFSDYVTEKTAEKSALVTSGIAQTSPQLDEIATNGGSTANMPFLQDLSGADEVLDDDTPLTPEKVTAGRDKCVILERGKVFGSNFLSKYKSGTDPMMMIADRVADYWARMYQQMLINTLRGAFASTLMASEHVLNISIAAGLSATSDNLISSDATINAFSKLGDAIDSVAAIAMHSDIYWALERQNVIEFLQPSEQGTVIRRYKGRTVIVDDSLPKVAGATNGFVYDTYLFGLGAIGYGEGALDPVDATETDRDSLQGDDYLINRRRLVMHPLGVRWGGTPAGNSPTNAELATAANWTRVYQKKNVRLVCLKTNG